MTKTKKPKETVVEDIQFDFQIFADQYVAANQKTWEHDRSSTLGSSEAFGCIRKAYYKKKGYEPDADYVQSYGAMERGNLLEDNWFVPVIRHAIRTHYPKAGLYGTGNEQTTLIQDLLSATPDGLVVGVPRGCLSSRGVPDIGQDPTCPEGFGSLLVEAKSIDPRVNLEEEKSVHHGQCQIQIGLVRENTDFRPNFAVIIYTDASWLDQNTQYVIPFDERQYQYGHTRSRTVFSAENPTDLMPEGRITGDCRYCEFAFQCNADSKLAAPVREDAANMPEEQRAELEKLVLKERRLMAEKKDAEDNHKIASEEIKHWLEQTGHKRGGGGENPWSVSYSWVKGASRISQALIIEAGLDPEDFKEEGNGYSKINVRIK